MNLRTLRARIGMVVLIGASAGWPLAGRAADDRASLDAMLAKMLNAIVQQDYAAFTEGGAPDFVAAMNKAVLDSVYSMIGARLKAGYETSYLGSVRQAGGEVHIWKIVYKDGGDESLIKLVRRHDQTDGFWIQ